MTTSNIFFSLVIIHNNQDNRLLQLLSLIENSELAHKLKEVIVIDYSRLLTSEQQLKIKQLDILKKIELNIIRQDHLASIYQEIKTIITANIAIFINSNYSPQTEWFANIEETFTDDRINFVMGKIQGANNPNDRNFNYLTTENNQVQQQKYIRSWLKMIGNSAIRSNWLQNLNSLTILSSENQNQDDRSCICRLLKELEAEINYNNRIVVTSK